MFAGFLRKSVFTLCNLACELSFSDYSFAINLASTSYTNDVNDIRNFYDYSKRLGICKFFIKLCIFLTAYLGYDHFFNAIFDDTN